MLYILFYYDFMLHLHSHIHMLQRKTIFLGVCALDLHIQVKPILSHT